MPKYDECNIYDVDCRAGTCAHKKNREVISKESEIHNVCEAYIKGQTTYADFDVQLKRIEEKYNTKTMEITVKVLQIFIEALWEAYRKGELTDNEMKEAIFSLSSSAREK
jgi:chromosome segregation and condensation protein ScpB